MFDHLLDNVPHTFSFKQTFAGLVVLLIVATGGYFFYTLKIQQHDLITTQPTPQPSPANTNYPPVSYITSINPIITPCKFNYFDACLKLPPTPAVPSPSPSANGTVAYQNVAQDDVFYWLNKYNASPLKDFRAVAPEPLVQKYFTEYTNVPVASGSASINPLADGKLPASLIINHVSSKQNINPRLLLVLMELLRNGQGTLLSSLADPDLPYFDQPKGFFLQMDQVADELRSLQVKYYSQLQTQHILPQTLTFFDTTYTVSDLNTPESLAVTEFLANHSSSRQNFEAALKIAAPNESLVKLQINDTQNFVKLYTQLFKDDPTVNH